MVVSMGTRGFGDADGSLWRARGVALEEILGIVGPPWPRTCGGSRFSVAGAGVLSLLSLLPLQLQLPCCLHCTM